MSTFSHLFFQWSQLELISIKQPGASNHHKSWCSCWEEVFSIESSESESESYWIIWMSRLTLLPTPVTSCVRNTYHQLAADVIFLWMAAFQSPLLLTPTRPGLTSHPSMGSERGGSHEDIPLCRPHSGTRDDLSAATAARVILINLLSIQIWQARVSLQQNTLPRISQVSKMDLLPCCLSQRSSCYSVFKGNSRRIYCCW